MAEDVLTGPRIESLEARLRAQEIVLACLCRAVATLDGRSAHAVAVALEVAEIEQAETTGEDDEVVRLLRRFRQQVEEPGLEPYS
ncbi:MAG TPA: hypothetical protein VF744_18190 [Beijerinckiaceae bacterium]|jgi:uncharacterized coiled-coil protein SlyX